MEEEIKIVKKHYDDDPALEWSRLERHPYEFAVTTAMMGRYIRPGERVLDIGGGPGRYSIHWAKRGCRVTLLDLSEGNVALAWEKAREDGVELTALAGDARRADTLGLGQFDHVFLMGPLYHLLEAEDRAQAVRAAMNCLKPGGILYVSFIALIGGMIYYMRENPADMVKNWAEDAPFWNAFCEGHGYGGAAFTVAYFTTRREAQEFMERFPLEKLAYFGQEGVMQPCMHKFMAEPEEVQRAWLDLSLRLCETEEAMAFSEHYMYIGRKLKEDKR